MRDASWPGENAPSGELSDEIQKAITGLKDCMDSDRKIPEVCMKVVDDLLLK